MRLITVSRTGATLAPLRFVPLGLGQGALTLKTVIQVSRCKARKSAQLSDRDFTKLSGTGIANPGSIA